MLRRVFVVCLAALVVLSGCHASTHPKTVADAAPGEKLRIGKAPFNGEYRLFEAERGTNKPIGEPLATHRLRRGEPIGFRRESGDLQAVAGGESFPIERRPHVWQMRADEGQIDGSTTAALIVGTILLAALIGQVAFVATY